MENYDKDVYLNMLNETYCTEIDINIAWVNVTNAIANIRLYCTSKGNQNKNRNRTFDDRQDFRNEKEKR